MKSRSFSVSVLLILATLPVFSCSFGYFNPKYHYLFYTGYGGDYAEVYTATQWKKAQDERFKKENIEFWYNYTDKKVSKKAVETAIYEELNMVQNEFFQYIRQQNDSTALLYWGWVTTGDPDYARWMISVWYYPEDPNPKALTKIDIQLMTSCQNKDIRNRYLLQFLRRSFYAEDYKTCIDLWQQYGGNVPKSALRTQCLNYYAGALKRNGRNLEAANVYASIGYFDTYLHYNVQILRSMYLQDPNSKHLAFVVQQFVNQYFEKPKPKQSADFLVLAEEVIRDGKSKNPALWKSAEAALAYIDQDIDRATLLIHEAESLEGSKSVKENVQLLRLIIHASGTQRGDAYEAALLPDLQWITKTINKDIRSNRLKSWDFEGDESYVFEGRVSREIHRVKVFRRAILLGVVPHYQKTGEIYKAIAYLNLYNETLCTNKRQRDYARKGLVCKNYKVYEYSYYTYNMDYWTRLFTFMENVPVEDIRQYVSYMQGEKSTETDKFLYQNSFTNMDFFNELIATKFMREEQYDSAIVYLQKVSERFPKTQNIWLYLSELDSENPFYEEWITKTELCGKYGLSYNPVQYYKQRPGKMQFCQLMRRLQHEIAEEKNPETRARLRYAYTIGLYNSTIGKSWALTSYHNGHENLYGDEETDFNSKYYDPSHNRKQLDSAINRISKLLDQVETDTKNKMLLNKSACVRYVLVDIQELIDWDLDWDFDWDDFDKWKEKHDRLMRQRYEKVAQHIRKWDKGHKRDNLRGLFCDKQEDWRQKIAE